jgi:hypothetical protein
VVRRDHLMAVVVSLLMGCAVLLAVGCAGVRSGTPQEEAQGHTQATEEQERSSEEARCGGTRTIKWHDESIATNDVPGCPKGGLLSGTDGPDTLDGKEGDDEIRSLGGKDELIGSSGSNVIYGGPGDDFLIGGQDNDVLYGGPGGDQLADGGPGEDVFYGGDGDDNIWASRDRQRDKLHCGEGEDHYRADKLDYVDSSCEVKDPPSNL